MKARQITKKYKPADNIYMSIDALLCMKGLTVMHIAKVFTVHNPYCFMLTK